MEFVRWLSEPRLRTPTLVCAFTGWNDAGDAASIALRSLVEQWGATAIAEIDPEPFTDFATVRPHVRLHDGRRSIVWPTVGVWSASVPGGDVVLALGPEPALRWKLFCEQFVGIAERLDVSMNINLGALLADVPHSRAVQIIGTASDTDLIERFDLQQSRYEGPTGIVGVLNDALGRADIPTASLWAAVPGYAAQIPSPKAALALVQRASSIIGTPPPGDALARELVAYDARVASLIADDEDLVDYVGRLESIVDEQTGGEPETAPSTEPDVPVDPDVDAGELVAEVERFLRDRDDS